MGHECVRELIWQWEAWELEKQSNNARQAKYLCHLSPTLLRKEGGGGRR